MTAPHSTEAPPARGVQFPLDPDGKRPTAGLARETVAAGLQTVDPAAADRTRSAGDWRTEYIPPFQEMVVAGSKTPEAWTGIARAALHHLQSRMVAVEPGADGEADREHSMLDYLDAAHPRFAFDTRTVQGTATAPAELTLPLGGRTLSGAELDAQLDDWVSRGIIEPSCAEAVHTVQAHPEWLALPGRAMVVLGVGSEMGPARALLGWGATVLGVDLPSSPAWDDLAASASSYAGRLLAPERDGAAGADLLTELPELAAWLTATAPAPLTLGTYLYADGGTHVRLSSAADALGEHLLRTGTADSLAYLATPMDSFVVPDEVRAAADAAYARHQRGADPRRLFGMATRRKFFARNYPAGPGPAVHDALVPQQGPNYTLAKRVQRWRGAVAASEGHRVSVTVAPASRTRSVVKNKILAAVYEGAAPFDIEIFEPETASTLLAALLVHDLYADLPAVDHPWKEESRAAASGGLWRQPYLPRTALPLAAVVGTVGGIAPKRLTRSGRAR